MNADEITCRQFVEVLTDYFEGALEEPTLSRVEEHLVMCDWCVTYAEQIEATIGALRSTPREDPPPRLQQAIVTALRDRPPPQEAAP